MGLGSLQGTLPQQRAARQEDNIASSGLGNNWIIGIIRSPQPTEVSIYITINLPIKEEFKDQSTVLSFNQVPHNPLDSKSMRVLSK